MKKKRPPAPGSDAAWREHLKKQGIKPKKRVTRRDSHEIAVAKLLAAHPNAPSTFQHLPEAEARLALLRSDTEARHPKKLGNRKKRRLHLQKGLDGNNKSDV